MANYAEIENEAKRYLDICVEHDRVDPGLYDRFGVKRGLRDKDGKGVLTGITHISRIDAFKMVDGKKDPLRGQAVVSRLQRLRPDPRPARQTLRL